MSTQWDARALWLGRNVLPHEPELRAWLCGRRVAGLDVDDIIQETYSRLLLADSVDHIRNPRAYAFQTAASVMIDHMRRMKVVPITSVANLEELQAACDLPSPERQVIDRQELYRLARAIAGLPEKVREVFRLRRIEGLSQREVAQRIGISENTVEKHMSRGLLLLLQAFRDGGNGMPESSTLRPAKIEPTLRDGNKDRP
jgi:RNA polymerase sigma factor (sigma-70 family)